MVGQPYVTSSSSSASSPTRNRNATSTSSSSGGYNPYSNVSSSSASNPYGAPTTTTTTTSSATPTSAASGYNPYANTSAVTTTTSTTTSTPSSSYNPYGAAPTATAPTTTSTGGGGGGMPPFSQALDLPPPVNPSASSAASYQYQQQQPQQKRGNNEYDNYNNTNGNNNIMATATAVGVPSVGGMSLMNSATYAGGPTNGLVSEGNPTKCHKIDYEIKGHEMQLVEIELDPQEVVIGEAGAMMFMEEGIKFKTKFGDGSEPKQGFFKKLMAAGGRLLTGESLFITHFHNERPSGKARVAFAAPYPGNIIPLNLANLGGSIVCQRDAFLCAAKGTKISMTFNKRIGAGFFGGEGFILQKLQGDGMAFCHAGGTIIKRELRGERLRLDTGCLVAFTDGIDFSITMDHGFKSMLFGGEGLFLAVLQGTGTVWMQSLPFSRMADRIIQSAPSAGGRRVGEGNRLTGGFGGLIDGDGF